MALAVLRARQLLGRVRFMKKFKALCPVLCQNMAVARAQEDRQAGKAAAKLVRESDAAYAGHDHVPERGSNSATSATWNGRFKKLLSGGPSIQGHGMPASYSGCARLGARFATNISRTQP
jgi:hypothetical protein